MTVWQGAGMHKTGPWSGDLPISLQWKTLIRDPLETGKFPEETTFVVFAMFSCWFHHLSWSLPLCCPSGYFRITQVHDDRRTCRMTWQYFLFVFCGNPRQRLESVTSYISSVGLWQTSDADSISGSVLSLISCCQQTRYDTFLFFPGVMKWFDRAFSPFRISTGLYLAHLLFFLCTSFGFNIWLVYQTAGCEDNQMTWLQCPLPGFCLITEIPLCNPYLMKALAKSTTEIKAVKLVKSCLFGWLKTPSSQG